MQNNNVLYLYSTKDNDFDVQIIRLISLNYNSQKSTIFIYNNFLFHIIENGISIIYDVIALEINATYDSFIYNWLFVSMHIDKYKLGECIYIIK